MSQPDARRAADFLAERTAAVVRMVGRAFGMVILLGLASGLAVLALYSTFESSGARAIGIVYAVGVGLAIVRLAFHRVSLARHLGPRSGLRDEIHRLVGRTTATAGQASEPRGDLPASATGTSVVAPAAGGSAFDAAGFRRMHDLRELNGELALVGLARRTAPLRPRAIGLSTLAVVAVVLMTMVAPLLLLVGLLAKLVA